MAELVTGQLIHEFLGTLMILLFLIHHLLNLNWWKNFYKGNFTPTRFLNTTIDLLLLFVTLVLGISGILISGYVFNFIPITGGMTVARQLHLVSSHWELILLSLHLGLHFKTFLILGRKLFHITKNSPTRTLILRILVILTAAYGIYAFIVQHFIDYLFFQAHFIIYDETKNVIVYFIELIAIMSLFTIICYF